MELSLSERKFTKLELHKSLLGLANTNGRLIQER